MVLWRADTVLGCLFVHVPIAFAAECPVDRISVLRISEVDTHVRQVAPIIKSREEKEHVNSNARGISMEANMHIKKTLIPPHA